MHSQKRSLKWWTKTIKSRRFPFQIMRFILNFCFAFMFRPKSGLSLRRRWLLLKTLCTNEAQLPQKINKGCQKKLLIFCKSLLKGNKRLKTTTFLYQRFESDDEESEEEEKILDKHEKPEPLSAFIHSTRSVSIINFIHILLSNAFRKMFLLQYALEVKLGEKTRLETIIKVDLQYL